MPEIETIKKEYENVLTQLNAPRLISNWKKFEKLSKRKTQLEKIIEKDQELSVVKTKIKENQSVLAKGIDHELVILAEQELKDLREREKELEKKLKIMMVEISQEKRDPNSKFESVIVEIRAGAGGAEAALFVADLYRMYSKYSAAKHWKQKTLDSRPTELGGFKEIIFELKDANIWSKMQYEGGVHRVQRIPATEKAGRIHTSTASVAVLPKPKITEIKIKPEDLKIDFYRASGPGGQYVNRRETAVRITHLPTDLVVTSQTERNQLQNKENAMAILEAKLQQKKEIAELEKLSEKRQAQIKWAKRAEKIRTYNFPQNRVTDHRIKKSWYDMEGIMNGKLDPMVEALEKTFKSKSIF